MLAESAKREVRKQIDHYQSEARLQRVLGNGERADGATWKALGMAEALAIISVNELVKTVDEINELQSKGN